MHPKYTLPPELPSSQQQRKRQAATRKVAPAQTSFQEQKGIGSCEDTASMQLGAR